MNYSNKIEQLKKAKYKSKIDKQLAMIKIKTIQKWMSEIEIQEIIFEDEKESKKIIGKINTMISEIKQDYLN